MQQSSRLHSNPVFLSENAKMARPPDFTVEGMSWTNRYAALCETWVRQKNDPTTNTDLELSGSFSTIMILTGGVAAQN